MQGAYASALRFQIESGSSFMTMSDPKGDPVDNSNQKEKPLLLRFKKVALVPNVGNGPGRLDAEGQTPLTEH